MHKVNKFNNLKEMVENSANRFGENILFNGTVNKSGRDVTFKQLEDEMNFLGTKMINMGLKDKYICVIGENRYEWALSYLSVVNGVGKIVPLDEQLNADEIESLINECKASAIVYTKKTASKIENIKCDSLDYYISMDERHNEELESDYIYDLISEGKQIIDNGNDSYVNAKIDNDAFSVLLFTSGTTGFSKGVKLSHKNLASNVWAVWPLVEIDEKDRLLSILPLHHTYECTCGLLVPIAYGATVTYSRGLKYIADDIKKAKPTFLITVPLITEKIYKKIIDKVSENKIKKFAFSSLLFLSPLLKKIGGRKLLKKVFSEVHNTFGGQLKIIISGASHIDPKIAKGYSKMGFYFLQGYGLTECSPLVLGNSIYDNKPDALGKALPGIDVRLADKDEKGLGEIIVKGPNVMLGYFNDESKTNEVIKDGWFYTGDMAKFKNNGFFYMTGRKKNIIVTKTGKNIYPEEIESEINKLLFVSESVIMSDHDRINDKNIIQAIIHPNIEKIENVLNKRNLSTKEISDIIKKEIQKLNKKFPSYKKIQDIKITLEEFKKTTTKKIKRHKVKE